MPRSSRRASRRRRCAPRRSERELPRRDSLAAAQVRADDLRDHQRAVGLLIVLEDRDHEARESETGGVEDVRMLDLSAGLALEPDRRTLGLQLAAVADG